MKPCLFMRKKQQVHQPESCAEPNACPDGTVCTFSLSAQAVAAALLSGTGSLGQSEWHSE